MRATTLSGSISRDETLVLLSRRIQNATALAPEEAFRVATYLIDSGTVTVYTMFYDADDAIEQQVKDVK
jgi:hypothetical protein